MKIPILTALFVSSSAACGLFVASDQDTYPVYVGNSISFIELASGKEELTTYVLLQKMSSYSGNYGNIAWLLPAPDSLEVQSPNIKVLKGLSKISAPVYKRQNSYYDFGCSYTHGQEDEFFGKDYYEVLQFQGIDATTYDIIYAATIDTIITWLASYGITLSKTKQDLVQAYIDKGWNFFYAAVFVGDFYVGVASVKLSFPSDSEVLPMRIARGNKFTYYDGYGYDYYGDNDSMTVYIYSNAAHKRMHSLADLGYANNISAEELTAISADLPELGSRLVAGDYITKLKVVYTDPSQSIDDDIVLQEAADDREFRELYEPYDPIYYFAIDPVLIFFALLLVRKKIRKRQALSR